MTDRAALKRSLLALTLLLGLAFPGQAAADQHAAFANATARASVQYRIVMRTLETQGREQTAAEVRLFRELWGEIIERFGKDPELAADDAFGAALMDVDVRLIGALIVIDIGSRDAAREALKPVGETLTRLRTQAVPPLQ
jgi:hypothetical protein